MKTREQILHEALVESNDLNRSCLAVAYRRGGQTSWGALQDRLRAVLRRHHRILHPRAARIRAAARLLPLFAICHLPFAIAPTAMAQPVNVGFAGMNKSGVPVTRTYTITPQAATLLQTDGTNDITGAPIVLSVPATGLATNLWVGAYTVAIQGIPKSYAMNVTTNFGLGLTTPVPHVWFTTNLVWGGTNFQTGLTVTYTVYGLLGDGIPGMLNPVIMFDP